jgi:hypothetical protein
MKTNYANKGGWCCIQITSFSVIQTSFLKKIKFIFFTFHFIIRYAKVELNRYRLSQEAEIACLMRQLLLHACKASAYNRTTQAFGIDLHFLCLVNIIYTLRVLHDLGFHNKFFVSWSSYEFFCYDSNSEW